MEGNSLTSAMIRVAICLATVALAPGCATWPGDLESQDLSPDTLELPGAATVVGINTAPAAWRTSTSLAELPSGEIRDVEGEACQYGVAIPIGNYGPGVGYSTASGVIVNPGWPGFKGGDGGFADAMKKIEYENKGIVALTDVKIDIHSLRVLILQKQCIRVNAKALMSAPAPEATKL